MTPSKLQWDRKVRFFHRSIVVVSALFLLWVGATGTIIQAIDLKTVLSHPAASDPTMQSIRDGLSGPPNFLVITDSDYAAPMLPPKFSAATGLQTVLHAARQNIGQAAIDFIELRMGKGGPIGRVQSRGKLYILDARTGSLLERQAALPIEIPWRKGAFRDTMKTLHRMVFLGSAAMYVELATTILLAATVLSGLTLYIKMLLSEFRGGRRHLFWLRGERWRSLHRCIALASSLFLLVVATTGFLLAIDTIGGSFYLAAHGGLPVPGLNGANPLMTSAASPLVDASLPAMLDTTLAATTREDGVVPIRVIRLRNYAGMPQGVVITGDEDAKQLVFNASTGAVARLYEPGYPETPFPFGWNHHEIVKQIHRGDYFGLTGRWMDLLTGSALVFLGLTGVRLYWTVWARRWKMGRRNPFWQ